MPPGAYPAEDSILYRLRALAGLLGATVNIGLTDTGYVIGLDRTSWRQLRDSSVDNPVVGVAVTPDAAALECARCLRGRYIIVAASPEEGGVAARVERAFDPDTINRTLAVLGFPREGR